VRAFRYRPPRLALRWRLAGWVAVVVLLCTALTFLAVYHGTGTQVRRQIDSQITGAADALVRDLRLAHATTAKRAARAAEIYVRDQSAFSSTVLFITVPGIGTSTNRPELFAGSVPDNGEAAAEQAEEDRLSARLSQAPDGYATLALPDVGELRVLKRSVALGGATRITVGVGEPLSAVTHAQAGVARAFILAGVLAVAGAILAAYLIGTRLTAPLRRIASVAARVDAGDLHPRIHDPGEQTAEVRVLAYAFNHMLDRLAEAFAGQRAFVADASHELRTPLTVIRGQIEDLGEQKHPTQAEVLRVESLIQAEIDRMARLIDDLLLLARSEQPQFLRVETIDLPAFISEIWEPIGMLAQRRFELAGVPRGALEADPGRLAQALRNLLGNAIEHTREPHGLVRLGVVELGSGHVRFVVEDDGRGIPPDERERVFDRFHRTDFARDRASGGAGLGLAIVRAIVIAHGGRVWAEQARIGGARIVIELPGFSPAETTDHPADPAQPTHSATRRESDS
jgi:two-component system, OmpR family, sensor kinase